MLDGTDCALVGTLDALHHLVDLQCITLRVSATESTTTGRGWKCFAKVGNFNIFDLTLLIDELKIVLIDLKYEAGIFVSVVLYKLHRVYAVLCTVEPEE